MTDQELNEKLLGFAGIEVCDHRWIRRRRGGWAGENVLACAKCECLYSQEPDYPNFLDPIWGIAYQVKWIWPKIDGFHYIAFHTVRGGDSEPLPIVAYDCNLATYEHFYSGRGDTIILAAAKAVEQLIDKEGR